MEVGGGGGRTGSAHSSGSSISEVIFSQMVIDVYDQSWLVK
jgi:hypothetical protein